MMRFLIEAGLALTHLHLTLASATVFSVHDDLLAFPQVWRFLTRLRRRLC